MATSYHRHDISDKVWALLSPHLPVQQGQWGGIAQDNAVLSMQYSWFFAPVYRGVIFLQTMENGVCASTVHPLAQKRCLE